jgi:hypothetical protein
MDTSQYLQGLDRKESQVSPPSSARGGLVGLKNHKPSDLHEQRAYGRVVETHH